MGLCHDLLATDEADILNRIIPEMLSNPPMISVLSKISRRLIAFVLMRGGGK